VDFTDGKFVGVGVFVAGQNFGNDDTFELTGETDNILHLNSHHGEAFHGFFYGPVEVDVLFEPISGNFHEQAKMRNPLCATSAPV
jgi:hypothetical protein